MADFTEHDSVMRTEFANKVEFYQGETGQFAVIPDGYDIKCLEDWQKNPNRIRSDYRFTSVKSLAEYLKKFMNEASMLTANYDERKIFVVIDGDTPELASHKCHKARFEAIIGDQIKEWLSFCDKPLSQVHFGMFLEERATDVVEPEAADIMEMVMTFDAIKKVVFKSSQRLHDGQRQFQYVEENEARGAVSLPDSLTVLAPVFYGMEPQRIKFMLRYRIEDGSLRFTIKMHNKEAVFRDAFDRCIDALKAEIGNDIPVYVTG